MNCCNIAITLIDPIIGVLSVIACLQQLTGTPFFQTGFDEIVGEETCM